MKLVEVYEQYRALNNQLQIYLEKFIETKEVSCDKLKPTFEEARGGIEHLLEVTATLEEDKDHEDDLKDLKYLLTDTLFLLMDLIHFCNHNELGRCQMRAINYLGKRKRVEVFGQ